MIKCLFKAIAWVGQLLWEVAVLTADNLPLKDGLFACVVLLGIVIAPASFAMYLLSWDPTYFLGWSVSGGILFGCFCYAFFVR
jgi:hypothetical protein